MRPTDLTAVILAGGKGQRLRPITESIPKALVPVHGRPMLHHLIDYLGSWNLKRFVICTGYKSELIKGSFDEKLAGEPAVECVDSGDVSMTDRLIDAKRLFEGPALICYGDTLANVDVEQLVDWHTDRGFAATVSVYPLRSPFGVINFDGQGHVEELSEKPQLPYWINIGFVVCTEAALGELQPGNDLVSFLDRVREKRSLGAYRHTGRHVTVNTEKERKAVETENLEFLTVLEDQAK